MNNLPQIEHSEIPKAKIISRFKGKPGQSLHEVFGGKSEESKAQTEISSNTNFKNIYDFKLSSIEKQVYQEASKTLKIAASSPSIKFPVITLKDLQETLPFSTRQLIDALARVQKLLGEEFLRLTKLKEWIYLNYRSFKSLFERISSRKKEVWKKLIGFLTSIKFFKPSFQIPKKILFLHGKFNRPKINIRSQLHLLVIAKSSIG